MGKRKPADRLVVTLIATSCLLLAVIGITGWKWADAEKRAASARESASVGICYGFRADVPPLVYQVPGW